MKRQLNTLIFTVGFLMYLGNPTTGLAQDSEGWQGLAIVGGYSRVNFLNPTFSQNTGNDMLKHTFGYEVGWRGVHRYFFLNATFFSSRYDLDNFGGIYEKRTTKFRGWDFSGSVFLMPIASQYISPYAGLGYVTSGIVLNETVEENDETSVNNISTYGIDTPIWKAGINFQYKYIALSAEYKQSFAVDNTQFQQFTISLTYGKLGDF